MMPSIIKKAAASQDTWDQKATLHRKWSFLRLDRTVTGRLGHEFKPNHKRIEIDITYDCNLDCTNCDRSCGQAPARDYMTLGQIEKFIGESVREKRKWEIIDILGGEPTLHPRLAEIAASLARYKKRYSPTTGIYIGTNGFDKKATSILQNIPKGITVINTQKPAHFRKHRSLFTLAPIDLKIYKNADYANACYITRNCGIALTRYGYYPCAAGGGVDRVFGFNIGRRQLPDVADPMIKELHAVCRYCGHFNFRLVNTALMKNKKMSYSWKKAYARYRKKKPYLTPY